MVLISAEEPFLIMADHHEIRKLSVDGSNYTILKQVSAICITALFSDMLTGYRMIDQHSRFEVFCLEAATDC